MLQSRRFRMYINAFCWKKFMSNKEAAFRVHLLVGSFCIDFQKCILQGFRLSLVLNFAPNFRAHVLIKNLYLKAFLFYGINGLLPVV